MQGTDRDAPDAPEPVHRSGHAVQFYESDAFLVDTIARFVGEGLGAGEATVVIATPAHRAEVERELQNRGIDIARAQRQGRYIPRDAATLLSQFMNDGVPDGERFEQLIGGTLERAATQGTRVRAFGEMVALLWAEQNREAALRVEELWSALATRMCFSLLCAYPIREFSREADSVLFHAICQEHTRVFPVETYPLVGCADDQMRAVARLQQRARALDSEVSSPETAERRIHQLQENLAGFFESAPVAISCVGPDGTILCANPVELRLLGYTTDEYVGHRIAEFHADPGAAADILERLSRGETIRDYQASLRCGDGSVKAVLIDSNVHWEDDRFAHARRFTRDITAQLEHEHALAYLAAIVQSSDDAIVGKTLDGLVVSWNSAAERIFGYTAEEMIGQPIARIVPPDRENDVDTILSAIRRGQYVDHFETERLRKDGSRIHVSLTVSPIRDSSGRVVGASKIARDVTDRKRIDAEREQILEMAELARGEAEAANRAKDNFLAMLSHELRNPLAAIHSAVVTAELDEVHRSRALGIVRHQSEHLRRLVDELLDVARVTRGRIQLSLEDVDVPTVVAGAIESVRPLIDERAHKVSVSLPEEIVHVRADAVRLEQILVNLLTNAAKYTDPGGSIVVSVAKEAGDAVVCVRDSGMGIDPSLLPHIFELFMQGEDGLDRSLGGLGVGLALVRKLVELHGGRVEARSDGVGKGSEFMIWLPALAVTEPPRTTPPSRQTPLGRARVLLVEDSVDARESLAMLLKVLGHEVETARDGPSALAALEARDPDVALIDIGLPGMDGYEVARQARAHARGKAVILVALTGYGRDEDKARALAAGFDYHVTKPIQPEALQRLVGRAATPGKC